MQYEIKHLHDRLGVTVVYVTHDQSEALTMSDRVAVFDDGRIQQLASPEELYESPENSFVAQFIGENNRLMGTVDRLDGGSSLVTLDSGEQSSALAVNCGDVGARTLLSVRPERVRIGEQASENITKAKVLELIYLGDHIRCRMRVHGDDQFIAKIPNSPESQRVHIGQEINIGWAAKDCRALDAKQ